MLPALAHVHTIRPYQRCRTILRQIKMAKEMYALEHGASNGVLQADTILTPDQLSTNYIKHGFSGLVCPLGGQYSINRLSEVPTCSYASQDVRHSLQKPENREQ
jgi:hypothetical protein